MTGIFRSSPSLRNPSPNSKHSPQTHPNHKLQHPIIVPLTIEVCNCFKETEISVSAARISLRTRLRR
ncbi:hypothetical protein HanHA300_Chr16g0627661 [Helianthus annuus]|nr:hypothetical protein HanHA300_Chr16g0627661 [Helianthus annuus]KAJ0462041.1 hypothetical protein HanHA89_Chr16g0679001 [Helianthus annuus]KAJ0642435.1 hypothetical protein HanLR1_Chr16g0638211 [Helianthus annuus]